MMDKPVTLSKNVADKISTMIFVEKIYGPGDRLPNERLMAEQLGVSRTSIREAFKLLAAEGVLRIKHGSGTYVTDTPGMRGDPLGFDKLKPTRKLMYQWYEARMMIEPDAARLAAERASEDEIREIVSLAAVAEEHSMIWAPDFTLRDRAFHTAIITATHNEVVSRIWASVSHDSFLNWSVLMNQRPDMRKDALNAHNEIVGSLQCRDDFGAMMAMRRHLLIILQYLESTSLEPGFSPGTDYHR